MYSLFARRSRYKRWQDGLLLHVVLTDTVSCSNSVCIECRQDGDGRQVLIVLPLHRGEDDTSGGRGGPPYGADDTNCLPAPYGTDAVAHLAGMIADAVMDAIYAISCKMDALVSEGVS